jgi:4-hydroxy-3-methylbut-2-en-1-yl diphosphate synthase IspG/GcpE
MNDLTALLKYLNDNELAVFITYRFDDFLAKSKQKNVSEVKRRGLSLEDLKLLSNIGLQVNSDSIISCPQCNSDRFFVETDYELIQKTRGKSYEIAIDSNRCQICGYNPAKSPQKGLINKLKQVLGFYEEPRMKRPEIDGRMFT